MEQRKQQRNDRDLIKEEETEWRLNRERENINNSKNAGMKEPDSELEEINSGKCVEMKNRERLPTLTWIKKKKKGSEND